MRTHVYNIMKIYLHLFILGLKFLNYVCVQAQEYKCLRRPEEDVAFLGARVPGVSELPDSALGTDSVPLHEKCVLLTVTTT